MHRFDLSKMMIILERLANRFDVSKMIIAFFSICLASTALRATMVRDAAIPRLLVGEAAFALVIVVLFIFKKPRKPSSPQHPLPSHEPPHLMRRVTLSRRSIECNSPGCESGWSSPIRLA